LGQLGVVGQTMEFRIAVVVNFDIHQAVVEIKNKRVKGNPEEDYGSR
jgi:hypothetical protein